MFDVRFTIETVALPLGISFFTFQQIAFLIDSYRIETKKHTFLEYCLFVSFFPQLIAGPIVNHKEIFPQFRNQNLNIFFKNINIGLTIFAIGLFKKVIFADGIAGYADLVFEVASKGQHLSFASAWLGALAFSFQLYFDFSGYTDMAIGLAFMFGVSLPINFFSPYKAVNIIDFWNRWHISLTRFFRNYLYYPIGGNRLGFKRQYLNIVITMMICGIWHGSAWTYIIWGLVHGIYIILNHAWRRFRDFRSYNIQESSSLSCGVSRIICFIAVVFAWVIFRSESVTIAFDIIKSMLFFPDYLNMKSVKAVSIFHLYDFDKSKMFLGYFFIFILIFITFFLPNTHEIMGKLAPPFLGTDNFKFKYLKWLQFQLNKKWAFFVGVIIMVCVIWLSKEINFIYFIF